MLARTWDETLSTYLGSILRTIFECVCIGARAEMDAKFNTTVGIIVRHTHKPEFIVQAISLACTPNVPSLRTPLQYELIDRLERFMRWSVNKSLDFHPLAMEAG